MREVVIKGIYKHYKGDYYIVEDVAYDCEDCRKLVVYRQLYGEHKLWVRDYDEFLSESGKKEQKYRFELQDIKSKREEYNERN